MVVIVLMVIIPLLVALFRKELINSPSDRAKVLELDESSFIKDQVLLKKSLLVLGLVVIAFVLHTAIHLEPAVIALFGAGILVAISRLKPRDYVADIEWIESVVQDYNTVQNFQVRNTPYDNNFSHDDWPLEGADSACGWHETE